MADQKIIDLPPLAIQALTDLYEVSANGALSSRETRLQMLNFMISNIAVAPYTVGDIIYADSATTLNKIPGTAVGDVLLSDGVGAAPKYGLVNLTTSVANVLPVVNGGTGNSSYVDGELLIGNSTGNTLTKSTISPGTGISVVNGPGTITISATGDQNIEYQDVYDNTVATSGDANTDLINSYPFTLSSTEEVARPFPSMTIAQSNALVLPINGGELWNLDTNRIRSNRGSDVTPVLDDVAYLTDIPVIVNDGSYGEMNFQGNTTETVIASQGVPVKIAGTYVAGPLADFTHLNGVLTYTGTSTKTFKIAFTVSVFAASAVDATLSIALNGTHIIPSEQIEFLGSTTSALHTMPVQKIVTLSTNDELTAFIQNDTNTDNFTISNLNFSPVSIGGTSNVTAQQVVISWNGDTIPTNVTSTGLMDITGGIISTFAEINVVTLWDGSASPVPVTSTGLIDITGGVISTTAEENVVSTWLGLTTPVDITAGPGIILSAGGEISAPAAASTGNKTLGTVIVPTTTYPIGGGLTQVWTTLSGTNIIQPFTFPVGDSIKIDCVGSWNYSQPTTATGAGSFLNVTFGTLFNIVSSDTDPSSFSSIDGGPINFTIVFTRISTNTVSLICNGNVLRNGSSQHTFSMPALNSVPLYDESLAYTIDVGWNKGIIITDGFYNFTCNSLTISQLSP